MTDATSIANRQAGPALDPDQRPMSEGKRWARLLGFAALGAIAVASINHRSDKPDEPPAASAAKQQAPGSTNAVLPQAAAPTKPGG